MSKIIGFIHSTRQGKPSYYHYVTERRSGKRSTLCNNLVVADSPIEDDMPKDAKFCQQCENQVNYMLQNWKGKAGAGK